MTQAKLNIFVRVVKRRMAEGEVLEDILAGFASLSEEDKDEIREQIKEQIKE